MYGDRFMFTEMKKQVKFQVNIVTKKKKFLDFPGGTVDKNLPANAGKMGLIPGLGRFHIRRGK